jgi:hypothetical protein
MKQFPQQELTYTLQIQNNGVILSNIRFMVYT